MAKVVYNHLVDRVQGKLCKDDKSPIFAYRQDTGTRFVYHRDNPYTGPASEKQQANYQRFKSAHEEVKTVMGNLELLNTYKESFANQTKYKTLRGFIFAEVYKNA